MGTMVTSSRKRLFPYLVGDAILSNGTKRRNDIYFGQVNSPTGQLPQKSLLQTTTSYRSVATGEGTLSNEQILYEAELAGRRSLFPYDNGHPFQTEDFSVKSFPDKTWDIRGLGSLRWTGNVCFNYRSSDVIGSLPQGNLNVLGAQAINATAPTKPSTSIAEFLAQLKSGQELPEVTGITSPLWGSIDTALLEANNLKETIGVFLSYGGKAWLNLEYGWAPFINDIKSLANSVLKSNKIVSQLIRDNGRPVRRKFFFPEIKTTTVNADSLPVGGAGLTTVQLLNFIGGTGNWSSTWGAGLGSISSVTVNTQNQWFKGQYMYHLPDGQNLSSKWDYYVEQAQKLLGVELTPIALWDLTPWSWLADWFADFSTVISNGTLFSDPKTNLVLRYGYMMETSSSVTTTVGIGMKVNTTSLGNLSTQTKHTLKRRIQATPYGFGLDASKFSDYQWSILAALGLSSGGSALHKK